MFAEDEEPEIVEVGFLLWRDHVCVSSGRSAGTERPFGPLRYHRLAMVRFGVSCSALTGSAHDSPTSAHALPQEFLVKPETDQGNRILFGISYGQAFCIPDSGRFGVPARWDLALDPADKI